MTDNKPHDKRADKKHNEPKISELEESLKSFRYVHSHDVLLSEIKKITGSHDKKKSTSQKESHPKKKEHEFKIADIEKMFHLFRQEHGHEKLEKSVASLTQGVQKKPTPKHPQYVAYKKVEESLGMEGVKAVSTKDVVKDLKNTIFGLPIFVKNKLKYKKYRYPTILGYLSAFQFTFTIYSYKLGKAC